MKYVILSKAQENYFSMFLVVRTFLTGIMALITGVVPFATAFSAFTGFVDDISSNSRTRDSLRKGAAKTKADARAQMAHVMAKLAGLMYNYGFNSKNEQIMAICQGVTEAALNFDMRDTEAAEKARELLDLAEANAVELVDYKITPDRIAEARTAVEAYVEKSGKTGSSFAKSVASTSMIKGCFKKALEQLYLMDNFMDDIQDEHPEEYAAYKAARKIQDLGIDRTETPADPAPVNPVG